MLRKAKNGVHWLEFDLLADIPNVRHGVFLRHGGVSDGHLSSLNVGESVGDDPKKVQINRERIHHALNSDQPYKPFHLANQEHGAAIVEINHSEKTGKRPTCDALMTQMPGEALMLNHADCQVAIFYDPIHHAVANVHSGWRGSVKNIYRETIWQMKSAYGTRPADLMICISPSLGPQSAEFINYKTELPENFWEYQVKPHYFDFWSISEWQLISCGVLPHHIEIARMDTLTHPEDCFSYRRFKLSGRHGTVVSLL